VGVPFSVLVPWYGLWLLVARGSNLNRLNIVVRDNVVWLWWVALILCIVLIDLRLCVLRYCRSSLVGNWCGVVVISMAGRVLQKDVSRLQCTSRHRHTL
jgi:hypothetical protein